MTFRLRAKVLATLCSVLLLSAMTGVKTPGAPAPGVESPVADAAMRRDVEQVRTLLKQGADVNAPQGDGMTALHWAAEHGDAALAQMLVYAGANVAPVTRI